MITRKVLSRPISNKASDRSGDTGEPTFTQDQLWLFRHSVKKFKTGDRVRITIRNESSRRPTLTVKRDLIVDRKGSPVEKDAIVLSRNLATNESKRDGLRRASRVVLTPQIFKRSDPRIRLRDTESSIEFIDTELGFSRLSIEQIEEI